VPCVSDKEIYNLCSSFEERLEIERRVFFAAKNAAELCFMRCLTSAVLFGLHGSLGVADEL
jgi:hypothetical protein